MFTSKGRIIIGSITEDGRLVIGSITETGDAVFGASAAVVYDETAKLQVVLVAQGSAGIMAAVEAGRSQVVLVAQGAAGGLIFIDTAKLQVLLSILQTLDSHAAQEMLTQTILAAHTATDIQIMLDPRLQIILALQGRTDAVVGAQIVLSAIQVGSLIRLSWV